MLIKKDDTHITDILTGKYSEHLITFHNHKLHPQAYFAFKAMKEHAIRDGINLQPASTFRDFYRQQTIWNEKFYGRRPVLDDDNHPIDIERLNVEQCCLTILRWSALPGTSRHHWGTDLDIYDPDMLPPGQQLMLEPWEYSNKGYFAKLTNWLNKNMTSYGFYRPYAIDIGGVACEPWHLSYYPVADSMASLLTCQRLLESWQGEHIAGQCWLEKHLPVLFQRFIK